MKHVLAARAGVGILLLLMVGGASHAQQSIPKSGGSSVVLKGSDQQGLPGQTPDAHETTGVQAPLLNVWGLDILVSGDGFGLGTFYRREFSEDLFGFASFSISESKDEREFEQSDPYYFTTYVPGKLNRFFVMPLTFGLQYRLFREDIMDTFRPFVNAGAGPAMIYVTPFTEITRFSDGSIESSQVEFFKSLGRGRPHYTASAFVGFGANFGSEKSSIFGVNFRYYFTYLFGNGLPSLYDPSNGDVIATKTSYGGFFITLNIGMAY